MNDGRIIQWERNTNLEKTLLGLGGIGVVGGGGGYFSVGLTT